MPIHASALRDTKDSCIRGADVHQQSADESKMLFELSRDGIFITNGNGKIVNVNQTFLDLVGYTEEEIKTINVKELYAEPNVISVFLHELKKNGSVTEFKAKLRTKAGCELVVLITSTLRSANENKFSGYFGIIRDVTDHLRADEVLLNIAEGISGAPGEAFFCSLVQFLALKLNMDYAFIGEIVGDDKDRVNTLSVFAHGEVADNFEYHLANTPCENVITNRICTYIQGVQHQFPQDRLLKEMGVESYIGTPLFDFKGKPLGIIAVLDRKPLCRVNLAESLLPIFAVRATVELERKRTEEALRESEERYKYLLESVTDYMYTVTVENGREIKTMHGLGCIAVTGYEPHEYKVDPNLWYRMVHEEDRDSVINHIGNLLSKKEVLPLEHRIIHKNGSIRWVKNTPVPRFDEQGKLVAYDGLVTEITERKQAEEALRESEEKYRLVVQNNNEAILVIQEGLIKFFNPKTLDITGFGKEELISKPFIELCYSDDQDLVLKHFRKMGSDEQLSRIESLRIIEKGGKLKWIEINSVFIKWEGIPADLCFLSDITERRYLQEELARAQRLETAGRVAGQIAHDFNNLLSPLTAYPTLIREEFAEEHHIFDMLDEMEDSATKIAEINQQLLALGRRGHYTMEPVDLNNLIHKVVISENLPEAIVIKEKLASDLFLLKAGSAQLTRAFVNLINNAREAMHGKGIFRVSTENTYLEKPLRGYQTVTQGEYVKLNISDTGVGIKSEILDKIFDPFFTTKKMDRKRGSGLGLSVVHGIIEDHHGYILVDSKIRKGTTFSIYFPVSRKIEREFTQVIEKSKGGTEKILVVDDDPIQRRVANQLLKRLGYKVRAMSSGERAVNHLRKNDYDLLLLDMVMDGIDGVETYRQILKLEPNQKAIILSGYAMSNKVEEALKLGAGSFVTKPITQKILANVVRKELDRKRRKRRLTQIKKDGVQTTSKSATKI